MTVTRTPRLTLYSESDDELVDQFELNWPLIDKFAGMKVVTGGLTPPSSDLFDGILVAESDTGKSWIARYNSSTGLYDKKWLHYPWSIECVINQVSLAAGSTNRVFDALRGGGNNINSSAADLVGGKIKVPVDGIYSLDAIGAANLVSGTNYFYTSWIINDDTTAGPLNTGQDVNNMTNTRADDYACRIVRLAAGDTCFLRVGHQHTASIPIYATATVTLLVAL